MQNQDGLSSPQRLELAETLWNSKLLQCKETRLRIEDNVQSLRNRIQFLQHEENKLLGKISLTKVRAEEVVDIKNLAKAHNATLSWAKQMEVEHVATRKVEVANVRGDHVQGLKDAQHSSFMCQIGKAEDVKGQMSVLNDQMVVERRSNFQKLVGMYQSQKQSELEWLGRREEILRETVDSAKIRYEGEIKGEERKAHDLNEEIPRLEALEKEMINR